MPFRAPLTNHHADRTLCPKEHKHTSSGKPLHPDCHPSRLLLRRLGDGGVRQGLRQRVPQASPPHPPRTRISDIAIRARRAPVQHALTSWRQTHQPCTPHRRNPCPTT